MNKRIGIYDGDDAVISLGDEVAWEGDERGAEESEGGDSGGVEEGSNFRGTRGVVNLDGVIEVSGDSDGDGFDQGGVGGEGKGGEGREGKDSLSVSLSLHLSEPNWITLTLVKMPLKMVDATISTFDGVFEKFKSEASKNKANFILFLADKDPSTSLSWCPDCVRAEPVIYKKLEESPDDVALLRAYVGDRATWRNPQHPWRTDSKFKLKGVPTLVLWENDAVKGRLEDHEAHVERKIDALLK
ncbi:hypothetical protein LguiA_019437 [Lonicera macranthoides]